MVSCEKIILGILTGFSIVMASLNVAAFKDIRAEEVATRARINEYTFHQCILSSYFLKYATNSFMMLCSAFIVFTCMGLLFCENLFMNYAEYILLSALYFAFGPILLILISYCVFNWEIYFYSCSNLFSPETKNFSWKQLMLIGVMLIISILVTVLGAKSVLFKLISKLLKRNSVIGRCCDKISHKI